MALHLRSDLSHCQVDGKLVFLDVAKDHYFRLSEALERRFLAYLRDDCSAADTARLVDAGLLIVGEAPASSEPKYARSPVRRSAMEQAQFVLHATVLERLDTVRTVTLSQLALKTQPLAYVLSALEVERERRMVLIPAPQQNRDDEAYIKATAAFLAARPYAPIETRCLVDSIALIRFLARRRLPADLVFAVTGTPFSAHCWVQVGDLVLNETLGNTQAHTPIRVV
ncbi:lasso peptide biosynthesis B2 protein [Luteimonas sp. RC10]|uniref:lasso peptide biosynthesis B2 protein n=1 Tax=Luteimonas sp. RC10 TaxID=2587035 RepID=UPI001619BBB6|nr:lasso peptide biosynthesis B2 protein [Luteimonas sp. RC10]MBB3344601.1 hypothetical protein [Luteimonas sp. RC10]